VTTVRASAHGRVNLMGEHTDYNGGWVLPTPIPQRCEVELRRRPDRQVRVWSHELHQRAEYQLGQEARRGSWIDYVQGCTWALARAGHPVGGVELMITSNVPQGSGVSSSAALEVAVLRALRLAFALVIDDTALALLGQRAENDLVGAPVGAMDQLAASRGRLGEALLLDTQTYAGRSIPLPAATDLLVMTSGVTHDLVLGDYRTRRAECEEAASRLGVEHLCDLGIGALAPALTLPAPLGARVRHVLTENQRVLDAAAALERGDVARLGLLFSESHRSQRDDYQVSAPAVDTLVAIASETEGVHGARLTGGGFGGSIVALAGSGVGATAAASIARRYQRRTGLESRVLLACRVPCDPS
jgi:galactokinase